MLLLVQKPEQCGDLGEEESGLGQAGSSQARPGQHGNHDNPEDSDSWSEMQAEAPVCAEWPGFRNQGFRQDCLGAEEEIPLPC